MSKLTQEDARKIAMQYNSIIVSEMIARKRFVDHPTDMRAQNAQYDHWIGRAKETAQELFDEFGIKVIGYEVKR
jgi:hypothetical protein